MGAENCLELIPLIRCTRDTSESVPHGREQQSGMTPDLSDLRNIRRDSRGEQREEREKNKIEKKEFCSLVLRNIRFSVCRRECCKQACCKSRAGEGGECRVSREGWKEKKGD